MSDLLAARSQPSWSPAMLFAFLAAVYLTVEAKDSALREDFRRRALAAAAVFLAAIGTLPFSACR